MVLLKKNLPSNLDIISIVCACIIPLLILGPFLPDLIISVLSIWFIFFSLKERLYKVYFNTYFLFFIFFWFACVFSSLLSSEVIYSLKSSFFYLRIGVFAFLISYLLDQNKKIIDYFYYSLFASFSLLVVDGYFQSFFGFNLVNLPVQEFGRVSSFFGKELILGSYISRLLPLMFALFLIKKKNKLENNFFYIFLILLYFLVFFSKERTAFLFINIFFFFLILLTSKSLKFKVLKVYIFLLLITFIFLVYSPSSYERYIAAPLSNILQKSNENEGYKIKLKFFTDKHDHLYQTAWNMFKDKPAFGHGPKSFYKKCKEGKYNQTSYGCTSHPHNFYIQLLAETGILGFSFLIGTLFYFIYLIVKYFYLYFKFNRIFFSDYQICLLGGLLITIWPFSPNGNFFNNNLMIFYGLQMGFLTRNINRNE